MEDYYLGQIEKNPISVDGLVIEYFPPKSLNPFKKSSAKSVRGVDEVSLEIKRGEIVALLGRNGAGKTTLLRAIAGELRPFSGTITTRGRVYTLRGANPGLIPFISSRENVRLMARVYGVPREERIHFERSVEEFCDLGEAYDRPYASLSSGMAGRVGFGFTTSLKPEILLMDETLGVGDEEFRKKAEKKAMEFMEKGETIVISTHSLNLVKSMCSRGIVLDRGRVMFDGNGSDSVKYYIEKIVNK